MKRRRHTPEQIVRKLREADRLLGEGMELPEVCKVLEVSERHDYNHNRPHSALGMMTPGAFGLGYRTYLETLERLSPLDGAERGLAGTTTINNHQLSQQVDR